MILNLNAIRNEVVGHDFNKVSSLTLHSECVLHSEIHNIAL